MNMSTRAWNNEFAEAASRAWPHSLDWNAWWGQTTIREPGFEGFARKHHEYGNAPSWAEYLWTAREQAPTVLVPYRSDDIRRFNHRLHTVGW